MWRQDITAALADHREARALFEWMGPSLQQEYVRWIDEAPDPMDRDARLADLIAILSAPR